MADKENSIYEFAVVEFTNEIGKIAVIPCSWIIKENDKEESCYWPRIHNKTNLEKAVMSKMDPDYDWDIHGIKVVRKSRTYKRANAAADYYENNSDIEPYSTDDGHRTKKKQYDLSDSESEQIPSKKKKTLKNNENLIRAASPPAFPSSSRSQGLFFETPRSSQVNQKCSCNTKLRGLMEKTLKEIELLKNEMVEMRQENKHLAQKICFDTTFEEIEGFPLTSIQELLVLNTTLEDHEEFSKYVHFFGRIGGKDISEVTRNVLKSLMTNSLALTINWVGGYGKQSMKELKRVLLLIAASVRQVPTTRGVSQANVEDVVKRWLRSAIDRDGGRMKRKSKSQNEIHDDANNDE